MKWLQALAALVFFVWLACGVFMVAFVLMHGAAEGKENRLSRQTGAAGIDLIKRYEGCVLTTYRCSAGKCTIGVGHTGTDVKPGMKITHEQAEELLRQDLLTAERGLERLVKVPLSQAQFDSLISFTFNVGVPAFAKSTLLKLLNAGDYKGASDQFGRWVHASGTLLPGLVKRRNAERDLFLTRV